MARRRKISEEFRFPEFDEKDFVRKERRNTKVVILTFIFGLIIGAISQPLWSGMSRGIRWPLIFLFAISMIPILYRILMALEDLSDYTRKNWFTTYASYLLTWLTTFIILINPPFHDETPPIVDLVVLPAYQEPGGSVKISAYIADNSGIDDINLSLRLPNQDIIYLPYTRNGSIYTWEFENAQNFLGNFSFTLVVKDRKGNKKVENGTFWYCEDTISLAYPENGSLVKNLTSIKFKVKELSKEGFRVFYLVNGREVNMSKRDDFYETTPVYEGWEKGKNVTLQVMAEVIHYFYDKKVNNTVVDSSTYVFLTDPKDNLIGTERSPEIKGLPSPGSKRITPGFEIPLIILSILIILLWKRRR